MYTVGAPVRRVGGRCIHEQVSPVGLADLKSLLHESFKALLGHLFSPQLKQADACFNASL
jgi:hypothetical protein